jgi:hypothetical protein
MIARFEFMKNKYFIQMLQRLPQESDITLTGVILSGQIWVPNKTVETSQHFEAQIKGINASNIILDIGVLEQKN